MTEAKVNMNGLEFTVNQDMELEGVTVKNIDTAAALLFEVGFVEDAEDYMEVALAVQNKKEDLFMFVPQDMIDEALALAGGEVSSLDGFVVSDEPEDFSNENDLILSDAEYFASDYAGSLYDHQDAE